MIVIAGQGLAGTALAWALRWRGCQFTIVDRGDAVTASRIAAGLITPVTGKRFALEPTFDHDSAIASAFYQRVESEACAKVLNQAGAVRILCDSEDEARFRSKSGLGNHVEAVAMSDPPFRCERGAFLMPNAARLDVPKYLDASRRTFGSQFQIGEYPDSADTVIDCTGIAAMREGRLPASAFQPAKGEILTLRIPGLDEDRVVHHGMWLARTGEDIYRAGATYSWDQLDDQPTIAGREELVTRLKEFLRLPIAVIGHDAATRPISIDRQPIVRQLGPSRWAFNGLGSKGALLAPRLALELAERLTA